VLWERDLTHVRCRHKAFRHVTRREQTMCKYQTEWRGARRDETGKGISDGA